jgi:hypothetical protein
MPESSQHVESACTGRQEPRCEVEQRRLSGTVRADKPHNVTLRDAQCAVTERPLVAVPLAKIGRLQDSGHGATTEEASRKDSMNRASMPS